MRALIVDDSSSMRNIECSLLIEMNIETVEAETGLEALSLLAKDKDFDLIVLDINMPEFTGLETLERIKEDDSVNRIPVVMCTSSTGKTNVSEAIRLGAENYIIKPFKSESFIRKIEQIVDI